MPNSIQILSKWWKLGAGLATRIMKLMALGLGLDDTDAISRHHTFGIRENETVTRANFYPATAGAGKKLAWSNQICRK